MAFVVSLVVVLILGPVLIPTLYRMKFGQEVRDDGPRTHLKKRGTATMGGVMILLGATIAAFLFTDDIWKTLLLTGITLGAGLLGFLDDYLKVVLRRPLGLKARHKILGQLLLGILLAWGAVLLGRDTTIIIPFTGNEFVIGLFYYLFVVVVFISAANAVNLTDGLDGLACGLMAIAGGVYVLISWMMGNTAAAVFAGALTGGCLGFLRHNYHPAKIFMGDTGSLALGGALAALAVLTGTELVLLILGAVFVFEVLSVIIQVVSFQLTGKRVFKMSPLHHHFELCGWPEVKVVHLFWLIGFCFAILGLWSVKGMG
ncbi:MAG: phospho-N-acetylmuramoyl-pentapeptide-transferase [Syntrophomonadaceae bacterium]|nr:phospho-N-acetylmuramoyl-pentapeptide-transferase [Thermoanaerobacterales bacterium]NLN22151.1 phospho-N-acetylmuramoyl-pentapeptide-transferase [Syntrophomonadaceae bacterium]